jgi:sugar O-acyltransferase (sialic acid O-acetyltransferase NeuD family)
MTAGSRGIVAVLGGGGHAKVVIATLRAAGFVPAVVLDDDASTWGGKVLGIPVVGPIAALADHGADAAVIAVGSNAARAAVAAMLGGVALATVVHPAATVDSSARLGPGTVVFAGAVIQPDAVIGSHVIVNTSATIDHDCLVEDFVHLAPGVHLAGNVRVDRRAFVGVGGVVIPGRHIGTDAVVGAGAVVVRDVPAGATFAGVPARRVVKAGGSADER